MTASILLAVNAVFLLSIIVLIAFVYHKAKRFKRFQDDCISRLDSNSSGNWFRINLARPSHFSQFWKLLGFEAKGILVNSHDSVRILARFENGEIIDRTYKKVDMNLEWIGNPNLASSNMHWLSLGSAQEKLIISADTGFNAVASREAAADICRIIAPGYPLSDSATSDFALETNKASLSVVVLFFALLVYAFVDGIINNRFELLVMDSAVWGMAIPALFSIPCYLLLKKHKVPSRESLTLSILTVVAMCLAYIPAIKRTDRLLSGSEVHSYSYVLKAGAVFEPEVEGLPVLRFPHHKEYWEQYETGSTHSFDLVRGPLKLWQLDHQKLDEKVRDFYKG